MRSAAAATFRHGVAVKTKTAVLCALLNPRFPASFSDLCYDIGCDFDTLRKLIGKLRSRVRVTVDDYGVRIHRDDWAEAQRLAWRMDH